MYGPESNDHTFIRVLCSNADDTSMWLTRNGFLTYIALVDSSLCVRCSWPRSLGIADDKLVLAWYKLIKNQDISEQMTIKFGHLPEKTFALGPMYIDPSPYPCQVLQVAPNRLCRIPRHLCDLFKLPSPRCAIMKSTVIERMVIVSGLTSVSDVARVIVLLSCELFRLDHALYALPS